MKGPFDEFRKLFNREFKHKNYPEGRTGEAATFQLIVRIGSEEVTTTEYYLNNLEINVGHYLKEHIDTEEKRLKKQSRKVEGQLQRKDFFKLGLKTYEVRHYLQDGAMDYYFYQGNEMVEEPVELQKVMSAYYRKLQAEAEKAGEAQSPQRVLAEAGGLEE